MIRTEVAFKTTQGLLNNLGVEDRQRGSIGFALASEAIINSGVSPQEYKKIFMDAAEAISNGYLTTWDKYK